MRLAYIAEIRFVSNNKFKIAEAQSILDRSGVVVIPSKIKIDELQTTDTVKLVKDKLLKAYRQIGRPLFVEHTGLYIDRIEGLPGGLTQIFWDTLQADRFSELLGAPEGNGATARTTIAYCDGRRISIFSGEIAGEIVSSPRGSRDFQWDCVFQPRGHRETFAEMGDKKNEISMRRAALDAFASHLNGKASCD